MDSIFNFLFKAVSVEPRFEKELCLAAGRTVACRRCADACPHDAVRVNKGIEIDEVDCSGCGLCVQACPTGALEARLSYTEGASAKCSQVSGDAQTIHCLGRLQATDILRLIGGKDEITLAHGDCASCPIGTSAVIEAIESQRREAVELAEFHDRTITVNVLEASSFDEPRRADAISRRELFSGGWRTVRKGAGEMLAPLDPGDTRGGIPTETAHRFRVIRASRPSASERVPWTLPRIADSCIMCPLCTNACTTRALQRAFEPDSQGVLHLTPESCTGCGACVEACPVGAVSLERGIMWEELSGGEQVAYRSEPNSALKHGVAR